ncbi:hypothetical protein NLU13_1339 [Sarocladium strictum]|uniref:Uncharacterized protein n=1 Tax=Sarocladium strictum TaxID=5046 RepID=A0AA39GQS5_SARSR|nr:hypothetical protein NLU13_1339 [Sarocladium strictum]
MDGDDEEAVDEDKADESIGSADARVMSPRLHEVENRKLNEYRNELRKYLDNPTCSKPGSIDAQSLSASGPSNARDLVLKRQSAGSVPGQQKAMEMCIDLLVAAGTASMMKEMGQIWDGLIGDKWPNLKASRMKRSVKELYEYQAQGPIQVCHDITCSPYSWNCRFGSSQKSDCADGYCQMSPITDDEEYCTNVDGLPLGSASIMSI